MSRSGIVNVRMVITEEKILSNIDKVQKMIITQEDLIKTTTQKVKRHEELKKVMSNEEN